MKRARQLGLRVPATAGLLAVLAVTPIMLGACGQSGSASNLAAHSASAVDPDHVNDLNGVSLLEKMARATQLVKFGGHRRLEYHYDVAGVPQTLIYEEQVTADGKGGFAIDPGRLYQPQLTTSQHEVFELLQKEREGFFYRYRDFGVRDSTLFGENYSVQALPAQPVVCGRACTEIQVSRRGIPTPEQYAADVDTQTGLVLRFTERSHSGAVLSRMEFTDFTLTPDLDGVEMFVPRHPGIALDAAHEDSTALGFQPAHPHFVPAGYQLLRSELVDEGGRKWVRRIYGDGVENLFFLQGSPPAASAHSGTTTGPMTNGAELKPLIVRVCNAGPWTVAEVVRGGENLLVIGKVAESELVQMLQSAL